MQALILCAGLGTRLRPLTDNCPKALVTLCEKTLLERTIETLIHAGATHIVVNIHHFGDQIEAYIKERQWPATIVISDERAMLLDTGGALRHALPLLRPDEPIVVHNVDIVHHIDLQSMLKCHTAQQNQATLAVSQRDTSRLLLICNGRLCGWRNRQNGETKWSRGEQPEAEPWAFSGIAVVEPSLIEQFPGDDHPYPVIPQYLRLAASNRIGTFVHTPDNWHDIGRLSILEALEQEWHQNEI